MALTQPIRRARTRADAALRGLVLVGYVARGALYVFLGVFALLAVWGPMPEPLGSRAAMARLLTAPFGRALLVLLGLGLLCYAAWRFLQGALDVDGRGFRLYPLLVRLGFLTSCATYGSLAVYALLLSMGHSVRDDGRLYDGSRDLLGATAGRWLVGLVGFCVICMAVAQVTVAWRETYKQRFRWVWSDPSWARLAARVGLGAKAIVFSLIGGLFLYAAWTEHPEEARGLGGVLIALGAAPAGDVLLTTIASGFLAYGLYSFVIARYRDASWAGIPVRFR